MLKRTREKLLHGAQKWTFEAFNLRSMLDREETAVLERHMGFLGQIPEHRRFQIDFLRAEGLKPSHSLLEIGCGPMTGGLPIIDYLDAGRYVGVDVRPEVLNLSWREIGKAGLAAKNPQLLCSANFGDEALGARTFDYVLSFSVLYHLADEILNGWLESVAKRAGVAYANVNVNVESSTWLQFPFLKRSLATYRDMAEKHALKTEELGTIESLGFKLPGEEKNNVMLRFTRA